MVNDLAHKLQIELLSSHRVALHPGSSYSIRRTIPSPAYSNPGNLCVYEPMISHPEHSAAEIEMFLESA